MTAATDRRLDLEPAIYDLRRAGQTALLLGNHLHEAVSFPDAPHGADSAVDISEALVYVLGQVSALTRKLDDDFQAGAFVAKAT